MIRLRSITVPLTALLLLTAVSGSVHARDLDAVLSWADTHVVSFPLDGAIARVHVRPGDTVSEGEKLIELDSEPIAITIRRYQAELAAREPVLADAKREYAQAQSLYEQTVLSDVELQRARHAYQKAGAELAASRARLDYALWQRRKAIAVAPWDAWIVQRDAEPGQMLVAEQRARPLLVLAKTGVMGATAMLLPSAAQTVAIGQSATVMIGDEAFSARVAALAMQAQTAGGEARYRVDVVFDIAAGDIFRAGQPARIRLP